MISLRVSACHSAREERLQDELDDVARSVITFSCTVMVVAHVTFTET